MKNYTLGALSLACLFTVALTQAASADCRSCWTTAAMPVTKCLTDNIMNPSTFQNANTCVETQMNALRDCLVKNKCSEFSK